MDCFRRKIWTKKNMSSSCQSTIVFKDINQSALGEERPRHQPKRSIQKRLANCILHFAHNRQSSTLKQLSCCLSRPEHRARVLLHMHTRKMQEQQRTTACMSVMGAHFTGGSLVSMPDSTPVHLLLGPFEAELLVLLLQLATLLRLYRYIIWTSMAIASAACCTLCISPRLGARQNPCFLSPILQNGLRSPHVSS